MHKRTRWFALLVALIAATSVGVRAQATNPTPVPQQKPDFSSMSFLMGTWTCHQMLRGKDRPDTSTTALGMDGMYMVTQDEAPPFDQYRTFPIHGMSYMTYDSMIKKWVSIGVDSAGNYGITSSPGWQGNTIVWTGSYLDGSSSTDTVTKASDTRTTDQSVTKDPSGKVTTSTITCTKSGS